MTTTRRRAEDSPTYDPSHDRVPSWKHLDTVAQRIVAYSIAAGIILGVCAWIGNTMGTNRRLANLEAEVTSLRAESRAIKSVTCFLAMKSDQPITPPECKVVTP